eukprot:Phypoly_transcript_00025.p1 GENE.Phypoly_transcript_00025~~Phypoly_transcript_00025.p1  ORF type:complete len:3119 (+),score=637.15 Phypoly_transcript_00025:93-9449(+)
MSSLLNVHEYCVKYNDSSKIKDKKDILKQIPTVLDVPKVVQLLDANSLEELRSSKVQALGSNFCSWSTLIKCLITVEKNKRASYKKELPDALKIVIKTADLRGPRLFRCVNDFFKHICETLEDDELYKCFSTDYSQILLDLVSTPGYCHLLRQKTFETLLSIYTDHLLHMDKGSSVDAAYDPNLNARLLFALVSSCPFDLMGVFPKLMKFFVDFFSRYPSGTKISSFLFSTINHLLLSCGPNAGRTTLAEIYPVLHKFAVINSSTTQTQLKESIFVFWRIILRLDMDFAGKEFQTHVIVSKDNLQAIADVVTKDLYALNALGPHLTTRKPISRLAREEANLHLEPRTKLVLELASEVLLRTAPQKVALQRSGSNSSISVPLSPVDATAKTEVKTEHTISPEHVAKRRRIAASTNRGGVESVEPADLWDIMLAEVCAEKATSPHIHTFTQLLWVLATQHRRDMPSDVEADCIASVAGALERMKDRTDTEVWLLRVLEAFAANSTHTSPSTLPSVWGSVWNLAVRRVYAPHPIAERALQLLRAILRLFARTSVASSPSPFPFSLRDLWKAPVFEEENNAQTQHMATLRAALELLVDTAGMLKAEDRERMSKWLLDVAEYLARLEFSMLTTGGRVHHSAPPLAGTVAQAITTLGCLTSQNRSQLRVSSASDPTENLNKENQDELSDFKTYRPLFEENDGSSTQSEVVQFASAQMPQSTQARIQKMCLTRLQAITSKLISDCQDITTSKKKTLGVNKSHLCGNITDMLYFLQVLSHIEQLIATGAQTTAQNSQTARGSSQLSTQTSRSSQPSTQVSKDEVCGLQNVLLQNIADHFANACKAADAKLLAALFTRSAALLRMLTNHAHHTHVVTITSSMFAYLKESMGLTVGVSSSSQVSSPMKKPKAKRTSSQESDVFDLVDETEEVASAGGTSQADLGAMAISALAHVPPCAHKADSDAACAIGVVEEKLGKILESTDNTLAAIEISEGIMRDDEKVVRNHALLLRKAAGMLQDPLCASDPPVRKHVLLCVSKCASALLAHQSACDPEAIESVQRIFGIFLQLWGAKKLHFSVRIQILECLRVLLPLDGLSDFNALSDLLLNALADPDIRVRMTAIPSSLVFFSLFEDEARIFSDINKRLLENKGTEEGIATILAALVTIAKETPQTDPEPLLIELCNISSSIAQQSPSLRALATQAATRIARAMCTESPRQLLTSHFASLVESWLTGKKPKSLTDFPYHMLECDNFTQFLQNYGGYVVAQVVLMKDEAALRAIAQTLGTNPADLLRANFSRVFASCFPLYYAHPYSDQAPEVCNDFLQRFLAEGAINTLIPDSFNDILCLLLLEMVSFAPDPKPPHYQPKAVKQILAHIATGWNITLHELLFRSRHNDRIQQVTLRMNIALASAPARRGERMRILDAFNFFIEMLDKNLTRPPILRDTILTLLRVLHLSVPPPTPPVPLVQSASPTTTPNSSFILSSATTTLTQPSGVDWSLVDRASTILHEVCKKALGTREGVVALTRELNAIVTTLVPLAQSAKVKQVIETLITAEFIPDKSDEKGIEKADSINKFLNEAIQRLDPLPEAVGTTLRAALELRRGAGTQADSLPVDELARLSSLPTPNNPSALLARLNNIHAMLLELRKLEIKASKKGKNVFGDMQNVDWGKLVRQLVEVCRKGDADPAVVILATECLGAIPHTQARAEYSAASAPAHAATNEMHVMVLERLNTYLADYDVGVVREAANCLRTILHTDTGAKALQDLSASDTGAGTADYLAPFTKRASKKPAKPVPPPAQTPNTDGDILTNEPLWSPISTAVPSTTGTPSSPAVVPPPPATVMGHATWVCKLTSGLTASPYVKDDILQLCGGVCKVRTDFAEFLFPHLIFDALLNDTDKYARVCKGLLRHFHNLMQRSLQGSVPRESVLLMLHSLNFLRKIAMRKSGEPLPPAAARFWHSNFWDGLEYMLVARAALAVGAHCTALLYTELWYEATYGQLTLLNPGEDDIDEPKVVKKGSRPKRNANGKSKPLPQIPVQEEDQRAARELLLNIFTSIGEPDSFYGLTATFDSIAPQLAMYVHEQNWAKALGTYDMVLQHSNVPLSGLSSGSTPSSHSLPSPLGNPLHSPNSSSGLRSSAQFAPTSANLGFHEGLMTALQNMGHYHILDFYLKGFQKQYPNVEDFVSEHKSQAAWRSSTWDIPVQATSGYHSSVYQSLRALASGDQTAFKEALDFARLETVRSLSIESTMMNISPTLSKLNFLAEIDHAWEAKWGNVSWHPRSTKRGRESRSAGPDFTEIEPLLALRTVLAPLLGRSAELPALCAEFSAAARKAGRFQIASQAVYQLQGLAASTMSSTPSAMSKQMAEAKLEEAKVLWGQGEGTKGLSIARNLLKSYKQQDIVRAEALLYTGKWLAHTRAERANVVEEHLSQAILQYSQHKEKDGEGVGKAHFTLAQYMDSLYQGLLAKAASSEWAATQELRQHKERELALCEKALAHAQTGASSADKKAHIAELSRHTLVLRRVVEGDRQDSQRLAEDRNAFLTNALTHYINALLQCDRYDVRAMFRLCSLWFNNSSLASVNSLMRDKGTNLPSYKFLPLIYQITSRVSANPAQGAFQAGLCAIIERVATTHPHHVLYQLFALKNGEIEQAGAQKGTKKQFVVEEDKVRAAKAILGRLQRGVHAQLLAELSTLITAYVELTYVEHNSATKKPRGSAAYPLPANMLRLSGLRHVGITTLPAESPVRVAGFSPTYTLCGGRSAPKIVECLGDDGQKYRQLVKGKDDLRQDAVMQQTFAMVNTILREAPSTSQRRLHVRTYKVVPLTHCAGLLEWVSNTIPLGGYLVGPQGQPHEGAHNRYRPNDKLSHEIWNMMSNAKEEDKLAKFQDGMDSFKPVFHHFFLEHFPDPAEWYAKRLNYTHSVASNSIVGYIVGLGDRHAHNILIECGSAELVHIDLGVAFEQGKMLRVPELVPFRLTRDIEDGMGITGVEGVFRRCCEETLKVLRARQNDLVTILEVFIHDPLYKWALDPLKALRLQRDDSDVDAEIEGADAHEGAQGNKDAERALLRLKQKLQGIEYGETLSVEGQVHTLINEARDPERLCKMYPGVACWAADTLNMQLDANKYVQKKKNDI